MILSGRARRAGLLAGGLAVCLSLPAKAQDYQIVYEVQSPLQFITVLDTADGHRQLIFDGRFDGTDAIQSEVDLSDPDALTLSYTKHIMTALPVAKNLKRILIVGLGGGSMQRFLAKLLPEATIETAEIDPEIRKIAAAYFFFKEGERQIVHMGDGRGFIEASKDSYDVIFLDAFGAAAIPYRLTTQEFLKAVKDRLAEGGAVCANLWDATAAYPDQLKTYASVFPEWHVIKCAFSGNSVLLALPKPLGLTVKAWIDRAAAFEKVRPTGLDLPGLISRGAAETTSIPEYAKVLLDKDRTSPPVEAQARRSLTLLTPSAIQPGEEASQDTPQTKPLDLPQEDPRVLSGEDKDEIVHILRLKAERGDQVWPGFGKTDIPIVLSNGRYEFLVGEPNPPDPWEVVPGDDIQGQPYHRRAAKDSQSFAVKINARWAGSIGTIGLMNRKSPMRLGRDFHIVITLHEVFHAFQAEEAPARFAKALAVYKAESRYPAKDQDFAAAWTSEGAALAQALKAADNAGAVALAKTFLDVRDARRKKAGLGPDLLDYERELEWLEGLAKYAEIRFYELAAARPGLHPILQWDFVRLEKQLGTQEGDLRFYLSGMAQARLLDRLRPDWKTGTGQGKLYLEDILRFILESGHFNIQGYPINEFSFTGNDMGKAYQYRLCGSHSD